jgi:hypothetical protein
MTAIKRVVCNKAQTCKPPKVHGIPTYCGGKVPHWQCEECGNCPRDRTARCVEVTVEDKRDSIR